MLVRCYARLHPRAVNCRKKKCGHSNQVTNWPDMLLYHQSRVSIVDKVVIEPGISLLYVCTLAEMVELAFSPYNWSAISLSAYHPLNLPAAAL
nr:large subunit ribosomal protein L40e [Ipomoea batatas]